MQLIEVYTDGASGSKTGKCGGAAALILYNDDIYEVVQGYSNTSNNRMELRSVINALEAIVKTNYRIKVYTDSQYVAYAFSKGYVYTWERYGFVDRKNADLWQLLLQQVRRFTNIEFIWVKGHAGNIYNERCDRLATQAKNSFNKIQDLQDAV